MLGRYNIANQTKSRLLPFLIPLERLVEVPSSLSISALIARELRANRYMC